MSDERTYGNAQWTLSAIDVYGGAENCCPDMAAHIRELQAEVAQLKDELETLKLDYHAAMERYE